MNDPKITEHKISTIGFTTMDTRFIAPPVMAWAIPIEAAKITSPAASSRATIGSKRFVTGPFALN